MPDVQVTGASRNVIDRVDFTAHTSIKFFLDEAAHNGNRVLVERDGNNLGLWATVTDGKAYAPQYVFEHIKM